MLNEDKNKRLEDLLAGGKLFELDADPAKREAKRDELLFALGHAIKSYEMFKKVPGLGKTWLAIVARITALLNHHLVDDLLEVPKFEPEKHFPG